MRNNFFRNHRPIFTLLLLAASLWSGKVARADSITLAETWKDSSVNQGGFLTVVSKDTGTFNGTFTVPGLSGFSADAWSNLVVNISSPFSLFGGDSMQDAPSYGGTVTATSATFFQQSFNNNGDFVNTFKITFTRSGNTLTVAALTMNPTTVNFPWSIAAYNYHGSGGTYKDTAAFEITLSDATTFDEYFDLSRNIYINVTNTITSDSDLNELDNIGISGAANYVPPVNTITAPTAGLSVSNSAYVIVGRTTDIGAVAGVFFSLNGAAYAPVTTANTWANWTAPVTLIPGTNLLSVYAVDSDGNTATNTVSFIYVLSTTVSVSTNGLGTVSPNYNGALLQIGKVYSMTAIPATGSKFGSWTGSVPTNSPTVSFLMASNLSFTANFIDTNRPTVSVTNLIANQRVSNTVFTVLGTAHDNLQVSSVFYQLNGTGWSNAVTANLWSNWNAQVSLTPGTNSLDTYAVDTSGNISITNNVKFVYVVSTTVQLQITGLGTLSPNYSNALLAIGQNYSLTAIPATGFKFGSWTGSIPTNSPTLSFLMASNLSFTANFTDTNRPTISVTNLIANQRVSNAVFTVRGTATDNWQVGNVLYQLNGTGWSNAVTGNNWTNWNAPVSLIPGTNSLDTYAVDTSGNISTTNNVKFVYVVSALLQVQITGVGTLSPNYSNAVLALGQNFTMTGTPATGFTFTNWVIATNGVVIGTTNKPAIVFTMVPNLMLQANFLDTNRPTVTITSPTANQKMSNAVAIVVAHAADNWGVTGVWYQLNSGNWTIAPTTNNWTNWNTTLTLTAGTNMLKAYALDLGGNFSLTNSVSIVSSNTFKLQFNLGTFAPNGLNFSLQVSTNLTGHIQYSTNLVNWLNLTNFVGTNATLNFRDPGATNSRMRFYRAMAP